MQIETIYIHSQTQRLNNHTSVKISLSFYLRLEGYQYIWLWRGMIVLARKFMLV